MHTLFVDSQGSREGPRGRILPLEKGLLLRRLCHLRTQPFELSGYYDPPLSPADVRGTTDSSICS